MKPMERRLRIGLTFLVLLVVTVFSVETAFSAEYYGFHRGTRPLGMGGAFTAIADDFNAVYFNPAGLAGMRGFTFGILDPMVAVSENALDLYDDFSDVNSDDVAQVADMMRKYTGENNHLKAAGDLHFGFKIATGGVMISAIGQSAFNIRVRNPVNPEAHITSMADYGGLVGLGVNIPGIKGLKAGISIKALTRQSLNTIYTATVIAADDIEDMIEDDIEEGSGASADIGVIYTFNLLKLTDISIGIAGLNVPEMDFGDAMEAKTQFNAGVAFQQKLMGCTLTEAIDIYDVSDNVGDDDSDEKKIHMGVELKLPFIVSARVGLNQGYYTAGATLNFKFFKIDAATYGEEIGLIAGQKEDRRYSAQISTGWIW